MLLWITIFRSFYFIFPLPSFLNLGLHVKLYIQTEDDEPFEIMWMTKWCTMSRNMWKYPTKRYFEFISFHMWSKKIFLIFEFSHSISNDFLPRLWRFVVSLRHQVGFHDRLCMQPSHLWVSIGKTKNFWVLKLQSGVHAPPETLFKVVVWVSVNNRTI